MLDLTLPGSFTAAPRHEIGGGADTSLLMRVLDEIDYGVMLVDGSLALRYANQLALRELIAGPMRLAGGRLCAVSPVDQHVLASAVADGLRGRRKLFTAGHHGGSLPVAVVPMASDDGLADSLALLVLGRRSAADPLTLDFYARSNGLTSAECAVLQRICVGLKPKEVAREQGVAISTVRSHICSIRNKTQTGSIRELLDRVAVLPPITPLIKSTSAELHREPATTQ